MYRTSHATYRHCRDLSRQLMNPLERSNGGLNCRSLRQPTGGCNMISGLSGTPKISPIPYPLVADEAASTVHHQETETQRRARIVKEVTALEWVRLGVPER